MEGKLNLPNYCGECNCIGDSTYDEHARDPHYSCELIWRLFEKDHKVNPHVLDDKCPFRNGKFKEAYEELHSQF